MNTTHQHSKLAVLGIAVVVLASGLAPPTKAQESYITDADLAAACEVVCNTFAAPQTEDECIELANSRLYEEDLRHLKASVRLKTRHQEEWDESVGIFFDEKDALIAVRDERIQLAQAAYAVKFSGLTAAFAACLGVGSATEPLAPGVYLRCSGLYAAGVATAWDALRDEVDDAREDFARDNELAAERLEDREDNIKALYDDRLIPNEESRNESNMALIREDLRICLERVNN